jgi:polyisoprenoid-binding protein YceI
MITRTNPTKWTLPLAAAAVCAFWLQAADGPLKYNPQPRGSKVTIEGTSTLHDWTMEGVVVAGNFEIEPAFLTDKSLKSVAGLNTKGKAPKAEVIIPVRSLKSGKERMDEIMQEAMKESAYKRITYRLTEMLVKGTVPASGTPVTFDTKGDLSMSGATNSIEMEVTLDRLEDGRLKFSGAKKLKMTDFTIKPPAPTILGMPTIRTGDEVTVKFEWVLAPKKE